MPRSFPLQPYRGLAQYSARESVLFGGRECEVDACAEIIAQGQTRILLLHGQTGCGKSSFLRAGLIPALEERAFGYLFLRRYEDEQDSIGEPAFIRSGPDPVSSLANELYKYLSRSISIRTAGGEKQVDLRSARLQADSREEFVSRCANPQHLLDCLKAVSEKLPYTLVIVLDQVEEVLTLTSPDSAQRKRFFEFLKLFNVTSSAAKLVISLRKDHSGEFIGLAQLDDNVQADFKIFLLPELSKEAVQRAIELPTSRTDIDGLGSPFDHYHFQFAPGVAGSIVEDLFSVSPTGGTLPVMQIICQNLYEMVRERGAPPWIIDNTLYDKASLANCVRRHVSRSICASFASLHLSDKQACKEERRWRKVLYGLARCEGDGRVHTEIVSKIGFEHAATNEGVLANSQSVLDYLSRADVLVLRQVQVPTGGPALEQRYSLGHDAVGLALHEMRIEDDALERRERNRFRVRMALACAAGIAAIVFGTAVWKLIKAQQRTVDTLIARAASTHDQDAQSALVAVVRASESVSELGFIHSSAAKKANDAVARVLFAMPDIVRELPPSSIAAAQYGLDNLLATPAGFVSARLDKGLVIVHRIQGHALLKEELPSAKKSSLRYDPETYVSASEPFPGSVLLMLSSVPKAADQSPRSWLVVVGKAKSYVTYSGEMLLDMFSMFQAPKHETGQLPDASGLVASLAGDVVVLTTGTGGQNTVRSLLISDAPSPSAPFSLGVQFSTSLRPALPSRDETKLQDKDSPVVPPTDFLAAGQWLSATFHPMSEPRCEAPPLLLRSIEAFSLRRASDNPQGTRAWQKTGQEIVAGCDEGAKCNVAFFQNPIRNRLIVLAVSRATAAQPDGMAAGSAMYSSKVPTQLSYVVVDSETGEHQEISEDRLRKASCSVFPADVAAAPVQPLEPPAFVDGTVNDFVLGFSRDSSIRIVRFNAGRLSCAKRLLFSDIIYQWRYSPGSNTLLALSGKHFLAWNLQKQFDAASAEDRIIQLRNACRNGLEAYLQQAGLCPRGERLE